MTAAAFDRAVARELARVKALPPLPSWKTELLQAFTSSSPRRLRHAGYPSASKALCGMPLENLQPAGDERPTCPTCAETAAAFDRVDRTAPRDWFRGAA